MEKRISILVTNDDGFYAPGINALATELSTIADVTVVAPDRDRSGASHSLTLSTPLSIKKVSEKKFIVEGTPTDCVHLALTGFFQESFNLVVSGINSGANMGDDVIYSGTVGAAVEGRFLGLPSIAVSLAGEHKNFETAAKVTRQLVTYMTQHHFKKTTTLSINVPDVPFEKIRGFQITRLGSRHAAEPAIKQKDPRGRTIYWIGPAGKENDAGIGTDFHAIKNHYVSITPLQVDLTAYESFDEVSAWVNNFEAF
jgi:5'-nucleotidase